jgi:hypothetical protein
MKETTYVPLVLLKKELNNFPNQLTAWLEMKPQT